MHADFSLAANGNESFGRMDGTVLVNVENHLENHCVTEPDVICTISAFLVDPDEEIVFVVMP